MNKNCYKVRFALLNSSWIDSFDILIKFVIFLIIHEQIIIIKQLYLILTKRLFVFYKNQNLLRNASFELFFVALISTFLFGHKILHKFHFILIERIKIMIDFVTKLIKYNGFLKYFFTFSNYIFFRKHFVPKIKVLVQLLLFIFGCLLCDELLQFDKLVVRSIHLFCIICLNLLALAF